MSTTEDLETQIEYIVNRYTDIDKEREDKIKQNKKSIENVVSTYAPIAAILILLSFLVGLVTGAGLFH